MDQYLAALVAQLRNGRRCRMTSSTENNQVIDVGDGFWKTVQGLGKL